MSNYYYEDQINKIPTGKFLGNCIKIRSHDTDESTEWLDISDEDFAVIKKQLSKHKCIKCEECGSVFPESDIFYRDTCLECARDIHGE